jgi:hypothetical protein
MKSRLHTLFFAISILAGQLFGQDVLPTPAITKAIIAFLEITAANGAN